MAGKVLSIEIGQTTTRLVEMTQNAANPKVFQAVSIDTPPDIVMDGMVQVTEQFVGMIRECIRARHITTKKAVFVLNSGRIANREVVIPAVKDNKIRGLLQANASEYFPVDLEQYQLVHEVLDRFMQDGAKKLKLSVLAIPKDIISSYGGLAKACGLEMEGMTYIGSAISQMMAREIKGDIKACLHMNEDAAILTVMENEKVLLQRTVNYGIFDAMAVVADSGVFGQELTMSDVRRIMQQNVCVRSYNEDDDFSLEAAKAAVQNNRKEETAAEENSEQLSAMRSAVTDSLRNMLGSVGRILDYYQSRNAKKKVERLYLTGFAATCLDLARLIGNELEFRVVNLEKFSKVHLNNVNAGSSVLVENFAGIGAGLSSSSLSVTSDRKAGKGTKADAGSGSMAGAILIFGVCLICSAALVAYATLTNMALKAENLLLNEQVNEMEYINEIESNYNAALADYEWAKQVDKATRSNNDNLKDFIEELEQKMPSEMHLLTLTATESSVNLNVEVSSKKAAATVVHQLRDFDSITVGTVSTITDTKEETGGRTITFSVDCVYVGLPDEETAQSTESTQGTESTQTTASQ